MPNPIRLYRDIVLIKRSGLFDPIYYLKENSDVRLADVDPLMHFVKRGWRENRNPSSYFDINYYLSENVDVQKTQTNPLIHFIKFGFKEGRKPHNKFEIERFLEYHPYFQRFGGIDSVKDMYLAKSQREGDSDRSQNLLTEEEKIAHYLIGNPKITIIIPVFNAKEFTKKCLEKILPDVETSSVELIVIDNASTDGTADSFKTFRNKCSKIQIIHNSTNRGFAPAVNQGINLSNGEKIVILNNDTIPGHGWLTCLSEALDRDENLGIVSPVTNYVGEGPQIDPGAKDLDPLDVDRYALSIADRKTTDFVPSRLVFFCVMLRRSLVDRIGGLDEGYIRGNFEDDDYCLRAMIAGYKLGIARNAFVYHYGSATFKSNNLDYVQHFEENRIRFINKVSRLSTSFHDNVTPVLSETPIASVIVRTVNRPQTLQKALNSLVNQTENRFEVVLVNDGGPNLTEFIQPYADLLSINYVHYSKQQGRTVALNAGVRASKGDWICFLDDDDIYYPWFFSTMFKTYQNFSDNIFFYGMAMRTLFDLESSADTPLETKPFPEFTFSRDKLLIGNAIPINTWFLKRDIFNTVGYFDETFDTLEDYEFLLRTTKAITPISIPVFVSEYRFYLAITNSMARSRDDALQSLKRIYSRYPIDNPEMLEERESAIKLHQAQAESVTELISKYPEISDIEKKKTAREILKIICAI